jgi:class 3 adenylate cyclase
LNRAVGTSRVAVTSRDTTGLDRFEVRGRLGGVSVTYLEQPFAWSEGEFFAFERTFLDGPARTLTTRYDLADVPQGSGCDVTVRVDLVPRISLLRPIVWFATNRTIAAVARFLASVDDRRSAAVVASATDRSALQAARARLGERAVGDGLATRLVDHVGNADDLDLAPIRPFALARDWSVDRLSLLRLCLEAVPAGLLELRWALVCPNCMTASQVLPSLSDLGEGSHCHACDLHYDTELDRAVEAQFFPHPLIRDIAVQPYCIGGPALTPHVFAQLPLEAGAEGVLRAPAKAGQVRLFVRGGLTALVDVAPGAPGSVDVTLAKQAIVSASLSVEPGGTLRVKNESGEGRHAQLQRSGWVADAATAHHVATMPEFRRLFGAEALRPGLALKVAQVAILFSDICGSTALYARVGDASAFGLVIDCIAFGTAIVERHRGALVKTIGDALMAAFIDPNDAAAAGAEMIAKWSDFARANALAATIELKVGAYAGPCTIVKANDVLDYFGQTVNAAARIQHLAGPRELVLSASLAERLAEDSGVERIEDFAAKVKGIDEPLHVVRFRAYPVAT